jgi:hypothetical protein
MKFSFRPTTIQDLNELRPFLQRTLNAEHNAPFLNPSVMAWKYWDHRGDWEGPRAYVLEHDGVIVAHAGIYPVSFSAGQIRGIQMIDWAAAKEYPGSGLALVRRLAGMFDFIYSIGGREITRKILPALGFAEYTRQWNGARLLRPFQQILHHQQRSWKLTPRRLVRNLLWARSKSSNAGLHTAWKSEEIGPGGISERFYHRIACDAIFSPRPPAFFDYLLRCPAMRVRLYGIQDERGPNGHFAIGVVHGQARIAGVWMRDPDREAWQAAYSLAQQAAMRLEGVCEIVAAGTIGSSEQAAVRSGLRIMWYTPVYLLNRKSEFALPASFQFQLSDDDAFYLDTGKASYWM